MATTGLATSLNIPFIHLMLWSREYKCNGQLWNSSIVRRPLPPRQYISATVAPSPTALLLSIYFHFLFFCLFSSSLSSALPTDIDPAVGFQPLRAFYNKSLRHTHTHTSHILVGSQKEVALTIGQLPQRHQETTFQFHNFFF